MNVLKITFWFYMILNFNNFVHFHYISNTLSSKMSFIKIIAIFQRPSEALWRPPEEREPHFENPSEKTCMFIFTLMWISYYFLLLSHCLVNI